MASLGTVDTPGLAARLHEELLGRAQTVACAESITGGGLADLLSATPGASQTYVGGVVSYATRVKRELLGVTAAQVVSADCAAQLATGVRDLLGSDWAVATTVQCNVALGYLQNGFLDQSSAKKCDCFHGHLVSLQ